ncbi:flagellar motor switch protein FliN [Azoarcus indigens]|uniref:Flagellar motor switch protein FliN n=1 Tax=Azoarcus indigens TaxID=29545 RepID=A0A4V3BP43_9RHOO|nr:FliM/FliN family flagellar motor switch protein [Azoarcus indigens]NMG63550.1 flagellar motor switch protein FliN [Azoarcus indigens]TDN57101.1 flagellar motor switch protein FliN/FliY [Azoarcus indigens]
MELTDNVEMDKLLEDFGEDAESGAEAENRPAPAPARPRRDMAQMMRKIPVTVTLEVGAARVSLQDLMELGQDSVLELDTIAGEPLVIKVNGTPIGRAEVVVAGENYGLKVVELTDLDLGTLAP